MADFFFLLKGQKSGVALCVSSNQAICVGLEKELEALFGGLVCFMTEESTKFQGSSLKKQKEVWRVVDLSLFGVCCFLQDFKEMLSCQ